MDTAEQPPAQLRNDYRKIASMYDDPRSGERIVAHYQLERRLADRLRQSTQSERENGLYTQVYDTLLGELYDHPRKTAAANGSKASSQDYLNRQAKMIAREVGADDVFLEVGGGDCRVALAVAPHVARSIVVDVTNQLVPADHGIANFDFVKTRGVEIPLPSESVSFIYSNQLMEHLHPEDAVAQLQELYRVLKPGGRYLCRTPSKVSGPHDVSMFFGDVARGMHMQEYSYETLVQIFKEAGFVRPRIIIAPRAHRLLDLSYMFARPIEMAFAAVPRSLHTLICRSVIGRTLLGITIIAEKPKA